MEMIKNRITKIEPWQRTLYILFFAQMMVAVGFSSIFPFLPFYVEKLGSSTGLSIEFLAGLVYSAQAFTMMIASPMWGAVADRYGRKLMVERSMFGGAAILLLMAFVVSAEQLVLLRAIQGLITGTVAAANALLASITPRRHMGYAMGLLQVGFSTGIAFGPLIGGAMADAYGYRVAFYITAAMLLLAGLMVWIGVRENFDPQAVKAQKRPGFFTAWRGMMRSTGLSMTFVTRFLTSLGSMMIFPIMPFFIQTLMSNAEKLNTFTGVVLGVSSAATTVSAIFLGRLGDRTSHRKVLIVCVFVLAGLYGLQGFSTASWHLLVMQALVGVAMGGVIPMISALLATYGRAGTEGVIYGVDNSITAAGRTVAPLLGAAVATPFGFPAVFVSTGVVFLISAGLAAWRLPPARSGS
jgi:DHA1 family multidrug resistance protein-like MFS transporter